MANFAVILRRASVGHPISPSKRNATIVFDFGKTSLKTRVVYLRSAEAKVRHRIEFAVSINGILFCSHKRFICMQIIASVVFARAVPSLSLSCSAIGSGANSRRPNSIGYKLTWIDE